jgi:glycosyltransferase involved in cell wall biosynthesis
MARIAIVTPAGAGTRNGNRHTALRWAAFLRRAGHRVSVAVAWDGSTCDLLLALHARRSHASVAAYRAAFPRGPLAVALTGTDLYRDLPGSAGARRSLELADRLIVLQDEGPRRLVPQMRRKTRVVYQSAAPSARRKLPADVFRVAVIGHLREEKDPFRAAAALARLPQDASIEVVHVGAGGLGQMLYVSLSVFKTHEAATLLIAMIAMVSVVDLLSAWLRRFLGRSGA